MIGAVASALGVATGGDDLKERVIASLRGGQTLVVLDCCDRVVDEAAVLAERMLEGSHRTSGSSPPAVRLCAPKARSSAGCRRWRRRWTSMGYRRSRR